MANTTMTEQLTPLDLLMPRTYVGAAFIFRTTETLPSLSQRLQQGLDKLSGHIPWLGGRIFPTVATDAESPLEIRWDINTTAPLIIDKGRIEASYDTSAACKMPPSFIPENAWPVAFMLDDASFAADGASVFAASLMNFSDGQGVVLCVCVHHNAVDATGFAEIMRLWTQDIPSHDGRIQLSCLDRRSRLSKALASQLDDISGKAVDDLFKLHPEHSKTPPMLPNEFAPCTSKIFTISLSQIAVIRARLSVIMSTAPTINTVLCALLWAAVTRARTQRHSIHSSKLAMAVNARRRLSLGSAEHLYLGNAVVYSLAESFADNTHDVSDQSLARLCDTIAQSQSPQKITPHHIAEIFRVVQAVEDYRAIYPGWDLFHSRDLTITSWADLDLYSLDFGPSLGKPEFIRTPYTEADGVGIILPRKRTVNEVLEVLIMLRRDDMEILESDGAWRSLVE